MADLEADKRGYGHGGDDETRHDGSRPEHLEGVNRTRDDADVIQTTTENPYREPNFIGTYIAIALACDGAFAGFVMPATSLPIINKLLGPSDSYVWIALAWTLCSSVGFTLIGRLSDIFGRRWFFAGCSGLATIGCIIGCTANSINQLIGAAVCLGLAAAGQISFNYVLGELVPIRHRFAANGFIFLTTLPFSGLGAYFARLLIEHTSSGWRGIYYLALAINAAATVCWIVFYHPPDFKHLHRNRSIDQELRDMDFGGIILFTGGLLLFLLGLSWGGTVHPWGSAYVVATLVVGALALVVFVLYETFMPLRRPLIPMGLFRNYDYDTANILSIVGGMVYYSSNVLFPLQAQYVYSSNVIKGGLISTTIGAGLVAGQFIGSWIAVPGGYLKYKLIFYTAGLCAFAGGLAGSPPSVGVGEALAFCTGLFIGLLEVTISTVVTIVIDDQSEIGTASGVFGSLRGAAGVIATAIYTTIFQNKATQYITAAVPPALIGAGVPLKQVPAVLAALTLEDESAIAKLPPNVVAAGEAALAGAYSHAFKITWLATIGFGGLSVLVACASRSIDDKLSHDVVRRLGHGFVPGKHEPASPSSASGKEDAEKLESSA